MNMKSSGKRDIGLFILKLVTELDRIICIKGAAIQKYAMNLF
jgi:hypothetical protein